MPDEKDDDNPIMSHNRNKKKQPSKTKGQSTPGQDYIQYVVLKNCPD